MQNIHKIILKFLITEITKAIIVQYFTIDLIVLEETKIIIDLIRNRIIL